MKYTQVYLQTTRSLLDLGRFRLFGDLTHAPCPVSPNCGSYLDSVVRSPMLPVVFRSFGIAFSILSLVTCSDRITRRYISDKLWLRSLWSLLTSTMNRITEQPETLRRSFMDLEVVVAPPVSNHTHGDAAANRGSGAMTAEALACRTGRRPFFEQMSRADERNNRAGSRAYFWAKDLAASPSMDVAKPGDLRVIVDTDYYMDMNHYLAEPIPTILYTFAPTAVAKVTPNYSYTFMPDNTVKYVVTGGGVYEHEVYNYSTDVVTATRSILGITYLTTHYNVDRKKMNDDHELVLFTPIASFGILGSFVSWIVGNQPLKRLTVNCGGMNRLRIITPSKHVVSTGYPGQFTCATVPTDVDDAICNAARVQKVELSPSTVESYLDPKGDHITSKAASMILTAFHRANVANPSILMNILEFALPKPVMCAMFPFFRTPDRVFPIEEGVRRYQFGRIEPDAKPSLTSFMSPIVHEAFAPDHTKGNEQQAVKGRIDEVRSDNVTTPFLHRCMEAFLERYVPIPHQLVPVDFDEVFDRQDRPAQRRILSAAESMIAGTKKMIKFFIKQEAYSKPSDPRIISTINDKLKVDYSAFCYAESMHLKSQKWYLFGKTPREIGAAVASTCESATTGVTKSDFSRFDGTISPALRDFEERSCTRKFREKYLPIVRRLLAETKNLHAVGTLGTTYEQESARGSGVPDTTIRNTEDNAFVAFVAYKCMKVNGEFLTDDQAWDRVWKSLFGGDDGLLVDMCPVAYQKACKMLGLTVKAEVVLKGRPGVVVLSRMFGPDVWYGDPNSCCDIKRQLSKIHTSGVLPHGVTAVDKLVEKARSYATTDANTPIIGQFVTAVMKFSHGYTLNPATRSLRAWFAEDNESDRFVNEHASWMDDILEEQIPTFDCNKFQTFIEAVRSLEDCLTPPICAVKGNAKPQTARVVVDDTLLHPLSPHVTATPPVAVSTSTPKRAQRPRRGHG